MFDTLDDLIASFNYKKELYEDYLYNLSLEEFKELVNEPNFFKDTNQKLRFLVIFREYPEKKKILLDNIGSNDLDSLLDNKIDNPLMSYFLTDSVSLNYLLEIVSVENESKLLDIILSRLNCLDILDFNKINQNLIVDYIKDNLENDYVLDRIFNIFYSNTDNEWFSFILKKLFEFNKFDDFVNHYKKMLLPEDLNDVNRIVVHKFSEQVQLIKTFFMVLKVLDLAPPIEIIMTNLFFKNFSSKQFERFVLYLRNVFEKDFDMATLIVTNLVLLNYINVSNLAIYFKGYINNELTKLNKEINDLSYVELEKIFLNIPLNKKIIDRINSNLLVSLFGDIIYNNDSSLEVLKVFLRKYFSYEKAVIFISMLNIDENIKIDIINSVYNRNITSISSEKETIFEKCMDACFKLEEKIPNEYESILTDLINLPYDEKIFEKLKCLCLKINKKEYLQIFLSQYFKKNCFKFRAKPEDYILNFIPEFNNDAGGVRNDEITFYYSKNDIRPDMISDYIDTVNHEQTHILDKKECFSKISFDTLMIAMEEILINDEIYYDENYNNTYTEAHARMRAFYETYNFLNEIDKEASCNYLKQNRENKWNRESFIKDRRRYHAIGYFCNIISTFINRISKEEIIDFRKEIKVLELVTDEDGRFYSLEEIEEKISSIKSYSTNDMEFNKEDRDIKLFYTRYLHYLKYGIEHSLIDLGNYTKHKGK